MFQAFPTERENPSLVVVVCSVTPFFYRFSQMEAETSAFFLKFFPFSPCPNCWAPGSPPNTLPPGVCFLSSYPSFGTWLTPPPSSTQIFHPLVTALQFPSLLYEERLKEWNRDDSVLPRLGYGDCFPIHFFFFDFGRYTPPPPAS